MVLSKGQSLHQLFLAAGFSSLLLFLASVGAGEDRTVLCSSQPGPRLLWCPFTWMNSAFL